MTGKDIVNLIRKLKEKTYYKKDTQSLIGAIERYKERTGRYPERVLADKIYRNRENNHITEWRL